MPNRHPDDMGEEALTSLIFETLLRMSVWTEREATVYRFKLRQNRMARGLNPEEAIFKLSIINDWIYLNSDTSTE